MTQPGDTQWSRPTRYLIVIGATVAVVGLVVIARALIGPLVIALLLSYLFGPVVNFVARRLKGRRQWAVNIVFFTALVIVTSVPATAGTILVSRLIRIEIDLLMLAGEVQEVLMQPIVIFGYRIEPSWLTANFNLRELVNGLITSLPGGAINLLGNVGTNLLWVLVVLGGLYYFLAEGPSIRRGLVMMVSPAFRPEWKRLLDEVSQVWKTFLWGQLLVFAIMFIPTVGSVYLVILLYARGVLNLSPIGLLVVVVVVYTLVQQIDNIWLRPRLFGETLKIHPSLVLIGLIGGLWAGGVVGALVVVPLMATLRVVAGYVHRKLLGLDPWPETPSEEATPAAQAEPLPTPSAPAEAETSAGESPS